MPDRFDDHAVFSEEPPRLETRENSKARDVPPQQGARKMRGATSAPGEGDTVSFDAVNTGTRWESVDGHAIRVKARRVGDKRLPVSQ